MRKKKQRPRRDAGRPRGEPVMDAVLFATLDEIAAAGVEGMSVDRIARAAEVNKTSIYRRWPTREQLAAAAFSRVLVDVEVQLPDAGSLRADLEQAIALIAATLSTSAGRALARATFADDAAIAPALRAQLARQRRRSHDAVRALVERAQQRREWRRALTKRADVETVLSMLLGAITQRVLVERRPATRAWVRALADLVARAVQ